MLVMGPPQVVPYIKDKFIILNYNASLIGYNSLNLSPAGIPAGEFMNDSFDMIYFNYIMSNDYLFIEFFNLIILLQEGNDVYLISDVNDYSIAPESLLKIIQQRYGYNGNIIHDVEDIGCINESSFTIPGLYQFDNDRLRYYDIINRNNVR